MQAMIDLLGLLHPAVVHFAVACPILALFAVTLQRFWPQPWLSYSAAALWILTIAAALVSGLTGHLLSLHLGFESHLSFIPPDNAEKGQLREHALWGTAAIFFSLLTFWAGVRIFYQKPWNWNTQYFLALMVAFLFGITGHEGGEMVYGIEDSPSSSPASTATLTPIAAETLLDQTVGYSTRLIKMNTRPWLSRTHGNRWVNTYVSKNAVQAYKNSDPLPEGSLVVKESFEGLGGQPSSISGPLYVMRKGKLSDSPKTGGWQYALRWDHPVPGNPEKISGPVTWLPGDPALHSCVQCHNHFHAVDEMGGVPSEVAVP
jgi:uncharacterized membrane protein